MLLLLLHHTPFNCLFSRTTWVSRYQKRKYSLDLNEARGVGILGCSGISWAICKSAPRSRQITHCSVFTGRMLFLTPNQQCQSTEGRHTHSVSTGRVWRRVNRRLCVCADVGRGQLGTTCSEEAAVLVSLVCAGADACRCNVWRTTATRRARRRGAYIHTYTWYIHMHNTW